MQYKNPGKLQFEAVIIDAGDGGAYVKFPFDVIDKFGAKGRIPIKAYIESESYRGSLVNMGTGCHILIVRKDIRKQIRKSIGDLVRVIIELDTEPRIVEIPKDLLNTFNKYPEAKEKFEKLSYSHKKEYVSWINEAKKETTRLKRINNFIKKV